MADAGLVLAATLALGSAWSVLVDSTVRLVGRAGGARPGRKVLTLVHAMAAGAECIDDADCAGPGATALCWGTG